ncbi:MAG: hypothetical protein ACOCQT_00200 [Desulfovermiculus sp.]
MARWLHGLGYNVAVNATGRAPRHEDWQDYADSGDLEINQRMEVKRLSVDFTGRQDWPFGSKFLVCARHSFDRAMPKPHAYIILNRTGTHAAIVKKETYPQWYVEKRTDSRYQGVEQEFYLAPLECVQFHQLKQQEGFYGTRD